jgi:Fe-S-cluster-containing hydrogenase component 2
VTVRITARCAGCGACLLTCPEHALRPTGDLEQPLIALADRCTDCDECVEICPADAIVAIDPVPTAARRVGSRLTEVSA